MTTETLEAPPMSKMLRVALIYADLGWSVFPCKPRGKTPITEHGLKDASTDPDQIREWWKRTPEANVALPTGVAFDVLDIDGDAGFRSLGDALVTYTEPGDPDSFPDGPTVNTGEGKHCYFAVTGLGNRAGLLPNVDWRGKGGYVIAPPSVHPSGAIYRFACGSSDPEYGVAAPLSMPPQWLVELIQPKPAVSYKSDRQTKPSNAGAYARRALESECERVMSAPEGQRNHTLNIAAFCLAQLVAAGALNVDEVIEALLVAAAQAGLDETESRRTIASGLNSGSAQPRNIA